MTWVNRYIPPNEQHWQGRADTPPAACFFQTIHLLNMAEPLPTQHKKMAFVFIGFCCDTGVQRNLGRAGAANGPAAIRKALARLPLQRQDIICYDAGDIICDDGDLESTQQALAEMITLLLQHNMVPIVLGGGHELAWGHYQGIAHALPDQQLGIVNFDTHFDMRPLPLTQQGSSGTPFLQIAEAHKKAQRVFDYNCIGIQPTGNLQQLFTTANAYDTHTLFAEDLYQQSKKTSSAFVQRVIDKNQSIYVSLCLDVFAAAYAPGVSAPQPFGLTPWQVIPLVRQLATSGKVISYDVAELSPKYDIDERTAKLAAGFIYEIIHHHEL